MEVTTKLDTLQNKFDNAYFNFRKFDVSCEVVASMIEHNLQFKVNQQKGLGYDKVPPPYNHNY